MQNPFLNALDLCLHGIRPTCVFLLNTTHQIGDERKLEQKIDICLAAGYLEYLLNMWQTVGEQWIEISFCRLHIISVAEAITMLFTYA